jgi:hypothetical protein
LSTFLQRYLRGILQQEAGPQKRQSKAVKTKLTQGGPSGQDYSDQVVLVMDRQETGHCERRPKILKGELENNSRKPRVLLYSEKWHSESLKRINFLFFRVRRRREIVLMIKMMMQ